MDHEEVESIPWGELVDDPGPPQDYRRIASMAAALLVAAVVGVLAEGVALARCCLLWGFALLQGLSTAPTASG